MTSSFVNALRIAACAAALAVAVPAVAQNAPAPTAPSVAAEPARIGGVQGADIMSIAPTDNDTQAQRQKSQPLNNSPFWREVNSSKEHYTSLKGREMGVLIQTGGEDWRLLRNGPVTQIGGWVLVAVVLLISAFFGAKGQIKLKEKPTGRRIERFTRFERTVHWSLAISFVTLGLTGLALLFGKHVVLPVFGHGAFSWIAAISKNVHNFIGPLFAVSVLFAFFTFVRDNIPNARDLLWLKKGGGLLTGEHVPSHRFNAGEKVWFWVGVFGLGIVVAASGFVLDFPNFDQTRGTMQLAWTFHAIGALLFVTMSLGHIYIGTLGMEGAYQAMKTGYVDESWAKEHHEDWYDDVKAGRIPAVRSAAGKRDAAGTGGERLAA